MIKWYLDENDRDIYLKDDKDVRWDYNTKELVRILNDLETKLAEKDRAIENWQTMYERVMKTCRNDKEEIERLREQIALTEKALELACERVKYFEEMQDKEMGFSEFFGYDSDYDLKAIIEQYKEQAKEMMKSE
jgi:histidinol dehydrogenase